MCNNYIYYIQHLIDAAEVQLQTPILHSLRAVINILASGKAPVVLSTFLAGGNLTALNKSKSGSPFDIRPIAVGEALRRLTGKCLCAMVKVKATGFFHPFQYGVACPFGAEKIAHGLRACIDEHWGDDDFAVLKIDMRNAFNVVSRQSLLSECAKHFPELLPWARWCYSQQPFLWHPLGRLRSKSGVQQGDPLGPLFFSLVLNALITAITKDSGCPLLFHAWYLDDGALAGPRSSLGSVLKLIQELGPPLGLHINISKCEVFSCKGLSSFPPEMKQSSEPNLDILGVPIGSADFCSAFISKKHVAVKQLLSSLEEVGAVDPQVAFTLHLARTTPPLHTTKAFEIFDADVFAQCTAVDTSDRAWHQARLSLSRGGLGLRSLAQHSPAAYIASLCTSGFGSQSQHHLASATRMFNSFLPPSEAINLEALLLTSVTQKSLSSKLDDHLFKVLLDMSSIADKARLLSVSSPHAGSWLSVTPSEGLGLHLDPSQFQVAIKWWLGLDLSYGSCCPLCPEIALDPLGHHAVTCKRGGDVVSRHNKLRDVLAESCRRAHLGVQVEMGNNLTNHSHTRPADLLVPNWVLGKAAAFDLSVTSPLNPTTLLEASVTTGVAALTTELRKHSSNDTKCKELDWVCVPLVVESYGAWGKEALESISQLASRLATCSSKTKSVVLTKLYGRLNLHLVRANAIAILSRSISQSDVG